MALTIKRAPILRGRAARDFSKKLEALEKQGSYKHPFNKEKFEEVRKFLSKQKALL